MQLKEFDRQLGTLFGAVKGVLWCVVITFFAVTLSEPARQGVLKSHSGYYIAVLTARAVPLLPQEVRAVLGKYIDELDRRLDPKQPAAPGEPAESAAGAGRGPEDLRPSRECGGGGRDEFLRSRISRGLPAFQPNIRNIIGRWKGPGNGPPNRNAPRKLPATSPESASEH